ncbi:MAG: AMP-binding protein [Ignavibacteria bacterium]|nr:AMP-binding protein [Ignavibacteria bacterium]
MKKKFPDTLILNGLLHDRIMISNRIEQIEQEIDPLIKEVFIFLKYWLNEDETIELITSGSTGIPKKIVVLKQQLLNSAATTARYFELKPRMNALLCLSPKYIAGKMMIVRAMQNELNLVTTSVEANPLLNLHSKIDFAALIPFQFAKVLDESPEKLNLVAALILGGSDISASLIASMSGIKTKVYHTYGMTETLSHIAVRDLNGPEKSEWFEILEGIEIDMDERDCLTIYAPLLCDKKLVTNDITQLLDKKRFKILGRIDDVIVSAGNKIIPNQIEDKLAGLIDFPFAISAVKDAHIGEILVLVLTQQLSASKLYKLWNKLEDKILQIYIPRKIVYLDVFPLLESGKLDRQTLKKLVNM